MSVKVDLDQLAGALHDFTFAYLVSVDDGYHAHTVAVDPVLADGILDVGKAHFLPTYARPSTRTTLPGSNSHSSSAGS